MRRQERRKTRPRVEGLEGRAVPSAAGLGGLGPASQGAEAVVLRQRLRAGGDGQVILRMTVREGDRQFVQTYQFSARRVGSGPGLSRARAVDLFAEGVRDRLSGDAAAADGPGVSIRETGAADRPSYTATIVSGGVRVRQTFTIREAGGAGGADVTDSALGAFDLAARRVRNRVARPLGLRNLGRLANDPFALTVLEEAARSARDGDQGSQAGSVGRPVIAFPFGPGGVRTGTGATGVGTGTTGIGTGTTGTGLGTGSTTGTGTTGTGTTGTGTTGTGTGTTVVGGSNGSTTTLGPNGTVVSPVPITTGTTGGVLPTTPGAGLGTIGTGTGTIGGLGTVGAGTGVNGPTLGAPGSTTGTVQTGLGTVGSPGLFYGPLPLQSTVGQDTRGILG